jgi:hypothetical protein
MITPGDLQAIKSFLAKEMTMSVNVEEGGFGSGTTINVKLYIGDEEIASDFDYLPNREND